MSWDPDCDFDPGDYRKCHDCDTWVLGEKIDEPGEGPMIVCEHCGAMLIDLTEESDQDEKEPT